MCFSYFEDIYIMAGPACVVAKVFHDRNSNIVTLWELSNEKKVICIQIQLYQ